MGVNELAEMPSLGSKMLGAPIGASSGRGGGSTTGGRVTSGRVMVMDGGFFLGAAGSTAVLPSVGAACTAGGVTREGLPLAAFGFLADLVLDLAGGLA